MSRLGTTAHFFYKGLTTPTCVSFLIPEFRLTFSLIPRSYPFSTSPALLNGKGNNSDEEEPQLDQHFRLSKSQHPLGHQFAKDHKLKVPDNYWDNPIPHSIYSPEELQNVQQKHKEPTALYEKVAMLAVKLMRFGFDFVSRYKGPGGQMTKRAWINRCLFLESVAGVPGMVAGHYSFLVSGGVAFDNNNGCRDGKTFEESEDYAKRSRLDPHLTCRSRE
jgi:hypothetical protein